MMANKALIIGNYCQTSKIPGIKGANRVQLVWHLSYVDNKN